MCLLLSAGCGAPTGPEWLKADLPSSAGLSGIFGTSANDVWIVGEAGALLHYDGTGWTKVDSGVPASLSSVWASGPDDLWVAGESGALLRGNGQRFEKLVSPAPTGRGARVWGLGPSDVYLMTSTQTFWSDGTSFHEMKFSAKSQYDSPRSVEIDHFSGNQLTGLWAIIDGKVYRGTGGALSEVEIGTTGSWEIVIAASANDVWLFSETKALRFDGTRWHPVELPEWFTYLGLRAGFAVGADLWLVGERGRIFHFDGSQFLLEAEGNYGAPSLKGVWGASAQDVWAVGTSGWMLRRFVTP
jgi:hypothetical protein